VAIHEQHVTLNSHLKEIIQFSSVEATSKLTTLLTTLTIRYSSNTKSGSMKITHIRLFE